MMIREARAQGFSADAAEHAADHREQRASRERASIQHVARVLTRRVAAANRDLARRSATR